MKKELVLPMRHPLALSRRPVWPSGSVPSPAASHGVPKRRSRGCESQPSCANSNHRADGRGRRKNTIEEESLERQIPAKNLHFSIPGPVFQSVRPPARPPPWVNGNPPCPPPSPPPPPPPPLRHGQGRISRQSLAVQTQLYDRKNPQP